VTDKSLGGYSQNSLRKQNPYYSYVRSNPPTTKLPTLALFTPRKAEGRAMGRENKHYNLDRLLKTSVNNCVFKKKQTRLK